VVTQYGKVLARCQPGKATQTEKVLMNQPGDSINSLFEELLDGLLFDASLEAFERVDWEFSAILVKWVKRLKTDHIWSPKVNFLFTNDSRERYINATRSLFFAFFH
jgi:hypothetical protein